MVRTIADTEMNPLKMNPLKGGAVQGESQSAARLPLPSYPQHSPTVRRLWGEKATSPCVSCPHPRHTAAARCSPRRQIAGPSCTTEGGARVNGRSRWLAPAVHLTKIDTGTTVWSAPHLPHGLTGSEDGRYPYKASLVYWFRWHRLFLVCAHSALVIMPYGGPTWQWKC